jgi:archaellum component FlaC
MSRIEIPMAEYNDLKNKIKQLESSLVDVSKEASIYKEKLGILEGLVIDLESETLVDRLFAWKKIVKPFKDVFKKNDKAK